jgi:hypothetical protein
MLPRALSSLRHVTCPTRRLPFALVVSCCLLLCLIGPRGSAPAFAGYWQPTYHCNGSNFSPQNGHSFTPNAPWPSTSQSNAGNNGIFFEVFDYLYREWLFPYDTYHDQPSGTLTSQGTISATLTFVPDAGEAPPDFVNVEVESTAFCQAYVEHTGLENSPIDAAFTLDNGIPGSPVTTPSAPRVSTK